MTLRLILAATLVIAFALPAAAQAPERPSGYLAAGAFDESALVPPPPARGSPAEQADLAGWRAAESGADGPAWRRAAADNAAIGGPAPALMFDCALNVRLDLAAAPAVNRLLLRAAVDAEGAAERLKVRHRRPRPYADNATARLCVDVPAARRATSSPTYPSGSATLGTAWSLILAELVPDRAAPVLARGREIGEGRLACRVHYASDVAAGRELAAAMVARLHAEPAFRADLEAARAELAGVARTALPGCD